MDAFKAIFTVFDRFRGWNLSFDPMTLQACNLAFKDVLCANRNILPDIGHLGSLEARTGQYEFGKKLSFDPMTLQHAIWHFVF